jgi:hypothetical protein
MRFWKKRRSITQTDPSSEEIRPVISLAQALHDIAPRHLSLFWIYQGHGMEMITLDANHAC